MTTEYKGIKASNGIAIGTIYLFNRVEVVVDDSKIDESMVDDEKKRVKAAIDDYINELNDTNGANEAQINIANAHKELLQDPYFSDTIDAKIAKEFKNSELALNETINEMVEIMSQIDDEYLKERASDYKDIGYQLMYKLKGIKPKDLSLIEKGSIVISKELTPSDTSNMNKENVIGFATDLGGKTSHTSIIAQTLDIPALVGMQDISSKVKGGEKAIIDGDEGIIILDPSDDLIAEYEIKVKEQKEKRERLQEVKDKEAITNDGKKVEVSANIGNIEDLKIAINNGCDGVGLFRTELLYMESDHFPTEEEQFEVYKEATQMLGEKPLIIRTLDIGGDKGLDYFNFPVEDNPFLGYRAIRLCLDREDIFITQLKALMRASAFGNLKIMIPMIINITEFKRTLELIDEIKKEFDENGVDYNKDLEVGIMIETPASVFMADKFIKYVDFFSIGTNDLSQYTLAVDRGNENISELYSNYNPAVLRAIKRVIDESHKAGKWTGMCGQFASDTQATKLLLGLGLDEFSASSAKIAEVKDTIIKSSQKEEEEFANALLDIESPEEVEEKVKKHN
ncbi:MULTISPECIES: phosphoenolpyruvate--protein phosphotransferase [Anaerococcus]|uniref:Phosphoenolpyruvate-protein phosphotransferase n=1 Tax=Anaerococcus octavius TaxID=54007 RepID=A0A2I1M9W0_9FIRM|nr:MULTISPECIES: phosphoenolpyruvate--protein phosphotransferase [Anaerococcus]MDU3176273.1 phosphoenolpyruvate--protein phosphotransferase [Anaerococcus sp.]PKZ16898.1 phosphoenolpyruvate--protein phosphotransferase [Anaerococcus octavius]